MLQKAGGSKVVALLGTGHGRVHCSCGGHGSTNALLGAGQSMEGFQNQSKKF